MISNSSCSEPTYAQLLARLDIGIDQRAAILADLEGGAVRLLKQAGVRVH
jgi:hypothetical protein